MRGDAQNAFREAAAEDGIELSKQSFPWLCERGHTALPDEAADARATLDGIAVALGGDPTCLAAGRLAPLPGDFFHAPSRTLIELDEPQHFTSARLRTLDLYPDDAQLGFDTSHYRSLCELWRSGPEGDGYRRTKDARCFGRGGRQRQRAYYDALRDLATPGMGFPPLLRIACPDRDGRRAYTENRARIRTHLGFHA
jgi:hypothetical protein